MPTRNRHLANERGLTLLETLVAVIMSGVMLGAAMPSMSTILSAHRMKGGLRSTANYVRVVRSTAVARNAEARLVVSEGRKLSTEIFSGGAWTATGQPVVLDSGVTISAVSPTSGLVFSAQGIASAPTTITIQPSQGGSSHAISVSLLGSVGIS